MKRKSLSRTTRFEVFKRDGFRCMYCGATPPAALLVIDHITPVAGGGKNDTDNLITACEPCNQGKGSRLLTAVPQSLAEKAAATAEREEQLQGYHDVLEAKRQRLESQTWQVLDAMFSASTPVTNDQFMSTKRFVEKLGFHVVLDAAQIAVASPVPYKAMYRYFCGICWNRIREGDRQ